MSQANKFTHAAEAIAFDVKHRNTIKFNISRYDTAVSKGMARYNNVELAKRQAAAIKRDVLQNWGNYLIQFEEKISARGVKVLWAKDAAEATTFLEQILRNKDAKLLVKSKSMTTEEIELNETAERIGYMKYFCITRTCQASLQCLNRRVVLFLYHEIFP